MKLFIARIRGPGLFGVGAIHRNYQLTVGQPLALMREPTNPVDTNAVMVFDLLFQPVGYIERGIAAKIAPLMDAGLIPDAKVRKVAVLKPGQFIRWPRAIIRFDEKETEERKVKTKRETLDA